MFQLQDDVATSAESAFACKAWVRDCLLYTSLFSQIDVYASLASLLDQPLRKGAAPDSQEHLKMCIRDRESPYLDANHLQPNLNSAVQGLYNQAKPYENRDPRLKASIYYGVT